MNICKGVRNIFQCDESQKRLMVYISRPVISLYYLAAALRSDVGLALDNEYRTIDKES